MRVLRAIPTVCLLFVLACGSAVWAQEHAAPRQEKPQPPTAQGAEPAHPPATTGEHSEGEDHGNPVVAMIARLFNFAVLVGALVYFLRAPIAGYLASRSTVIRQDLVTAADMRTTASTQLEEIGRKMAALPKELEALRTQGAEDVKTEQARMAAAAEHERERLLEQTRREIDMKLRIARRDLMEHAAQLAVGVAEQRIKRSINPDDQIRLVDRYASQLRESR